MTPIIGDAIEGLISSTVGPLFARLIDLIPDPAEKARQAAAVQQQLLLADAAMVAQQNAVNLAEASNSNLFVSGGRPAVIWICAGALAWQLMLAPFATFWLNVFGLHPVLPVLDNSWISALLIPLLGLGAMKTVERLNGVSNEGQKPAQMIAVVPSQSVMDLPSAPVVDTSNQMQRVGGG